MNVNQFKVLIQAEGCQQYVCDDFGNPLYFPMEVAGRVDAAQRKRHRFGVWVWLVTDLTEKQDKAMAEFYDKQGFVDGGV